MQKNQIDELVNSTDPLFHILFTGPMCSGKSTQLLAYMTRPNTLYIHTQLDDITPSTGIPRITSYCKGTGRRRVIIDDFDLLGPNSQLVLAHSMDRYANTVQFILSANSMASVINAVQDRCLHFYLDPIMGPADTPPMNYKRFQHRLNKERLILGTPTQDVSMDSESFIPRSWFAEHIQKHRDQVSLSSLVQDGLALCAQGYNMADIMYGWQQSGLMPDDTILLELMSQHRPDEIAMAYFTHRLNQSIIADKNNMQP